MENNNFNINLTGVGGVLIDIDNTLYKYQPCHECAIVKCFEVFESFNLRQLDFEDFNEKYTNSRTEVTNRLKPQGTCRSRLFAFQKMLEEMQIVQSYFYSLKLENTYWETFTGSMKVDFFAYEFLKKCKSLKIPVCGVTDMQSHFQVKKLEKLGILDLIQFLTTSEEVGAEKPNSQIFEASLKKLQIPASQAIMIGDSYEKDIKGAEALGIKAFLVNL